MFDGSAKTKAGLSLNECLEAGPNLNPNVLAVLLHWRNSKIAWIADIAKAFLQIELDENDSEAIRFLWVEDPSDPSSPVKAYKWNRITFGLTCSPFLLRAVIIKHIKLYADIYPETVQMLLDQLYVDDLLGGAGSKEQAIRMIREMKEIFEAARMDL